MKIIKYYIFSVLMIAVISSCSLKKGDFEELPLFGDKEIVSFKFEHRYETVNSSGVPYVEIIGIGTSDNVVDKNAFTVTINKLIIPGATSTFTPAERIKISLSNVIGIANISTGATIKPSDGGAPLGKFGDYSATRKFLVTAADGTSQEWTVKILNPLPVINKYEGTYKESGTLVRGTNVPDILTGDVYLSTINANTVLAQAGTSVFDNPAILYQIQINADNTVTIKSEPSASVVITPQVGVPSTYDPVTKTFDLHYQYTTSALRKFDTKLIIK